jgi:hypothetical protein
MVGAAGCSLVGAGGVLGLRPRGSRYALAARALPLRLALRACSSRYVLAARDLPLRLVLSARGLGFALAARAARSRLICTDLEKNKK